MLKKKRKHLQKIIISPKPKIYMHISTRYAIQKFLSIQHHRNNFLCVRAYTKNKQKKNIISNILFSQTYLFFIN